MSNPTVPIQQQGMVPVQYQQPQQQPYPQQQYPPQQYPPQPMQQQPYPQQQYPQQPYPQMPQYPYQQGPIQQVNVVMANNTPAVVTVKQQKSVGIALLLTFLFGPLGMLYSTVSGAVIMLIVSVVLGFFTFGFSVLITWPICMVWGAVAANSHNTTNT